MKYIISISLLLIYLTSSLHSSYVLLDFYMHRDDYTQKYCVFLDQGISQCRASCYLEKLLENKKQSREENLRPSEREKDQEKISEESIDPSEPLGKLSANSFHYANTYQFDAFQFVFHPPKG